MFFKKTPSISTKELEKNLPNKPFIIDVREPNEFKGGHIPGSKNIPLSKIGNVKSKERIYLVCATGMRSKRATKQLLSQGYDAVNVSRGMSAWTGSRKGGTL